MLENSWKVSVIIPSYNSGKFLDEAVQSVVSQTYQNLEIIVVNDGSDDCTEEVAQKWQVADRRIKYIKHSRNQGLSAARNTGIKNAIGEYIAFLDADDVWLPKKIEIQIEKIKETNTDLAFSDWYVWDPQKDIKTKVFGSSPIKGKKDLLKFLIKKNFGNPSTAILRKAGLNRIGLFDESLPSSEDYDLWLRFILSGMKIIFINQPLVYYRVHSNQMTGDDYKMRVSRLIVFKKIVKRNPFFLIKYPLLLKKIILLEGYKLTQDLFNLFKRYD